MAAEYCDWVERCEGRGSEDDHCEDYTEVYYLSWLDDCAVENACTFVPGGAPECTESMRAASCGLGVDEFDAAALRACAGYWDCGAESFVDLCEQ